MDDFSKELRKTALGDGKNSANAESNLTDTRSSLINQLMPTDLKTASTNLKFAVAGGASVALQNGFDLKAAKDLAKDINLEHTVKSESIFQGRFTNGLSDVAREAQVKVISARSAYKDYIKASSLNLAASNEFRAVSAQYLPNEQSLKGASNQLFTDRHIYLNTPQNFGIGDQIHSKAVIGTAEEIAQGKKLFLAGSRDANVLELLEHTNQNMMTKNLLQEHALAKAEISLSRFAENKKFIQDVGYREVATSGFAKGFIVSAASLGTAYACDKMVGNSPSTESIPRMLIDGVAVPTALLGGRNRIVAAAALFAFSRSIGAYETSYSSGIKKYEPGTNLKPTPEMESALRRRER